MFSCLTSRFYTRPVPSMRGACNSPSEFLKIIGRGSSDYVDKFPTWESLFTKSSRELKEAGVPVRPRKWILSWAAKYRLGHDPEYIPPSAKAVAKGKCKP